MNGPSIEDYNMMIRTMSRDYHNKHRYATKLWTHKKTGKLYFTISSDIVINATNAQDGQKMVLYSDGVRRYVREVSEFEQKFEPVEKR